MQDLSGPEGKKNAHLMSAARIILWCSKQSLAIAMCLEQTQKTRTSTILWENGAVISGGRTELSKRDGESCIVKAGFEWRLK